MYNDIFFTIFLIFCGAAIMATLALYTRQTLLVAYILLGVLIGPWGLGYISDPHVLNDVGDMGIIFLLFVLGLNLEPQSLLKGLSQTTVVTLLSSACFAVIGAGAAFLSGLELWDSLVIGICMMFSSTIIGLKLLPTTVLHHKKIGEIVINILLFQDILAIFVLLIIHGAKVNHGIHLFPFLKSLFALPLLVAFTFLVERFILMKLIQQFSRIHEYLFLIAIAWCLGIGQLAESLNLSFEIGAFIAGISIAQGPISRFIAESLRPLRDFFLVLFFFSLGAKINVSDLYIVFVPAMALAILMLLVKPFIFQLLIDKLISSRRRAWEVGVRLGQISEFSLLVGYTAEKSGLIKPLTFSLIQIATIITFVLSSYWVVNYFPNPIALSDKLRKD